MSSPPTGTTAELRHFFAASEAAPSGDVCQRAGCGRGRVHGVHIQPGDSAARDEACREALALARMLKARAG
jgi:hypothetical protein